jgi:predicted DNA-binding transcriptional regulator YafY
MNRQVGITAAMRPFRAPGNMKRRMLRRTGYYSGPMKFLRFMKRMPKKWKAQAQQRIRPKLEEERPMNRMDRLTAIALLLQGGKRTVDEIARRFAVSKRTIYRDMQSLCEMGVPVITEPGAHGGYTLMPDYSLAPLQLTLHETLLLRLALSSVSQLADTPFKAERESLLAKMQAHQQHDADHLLDTIRLDVPERHYTTPWIEQLLESARSGQWLRLSYRSQRGASHSTILPHRLYSAAGFWYCEAYALERREERTFRVDRMVEVSATEAPALVESLPAPVGLPYGHPSHAEVRIQLTARGVLLMERDPQLGDAIQLHGEEGGGLLCFRCPPSEYDWLVQTALQLGPDADVLAPAILRQRIRAASEEIARQYTE